MWRSSFESGLEWNRKPRFNYLLVRMRCDAFYKILLDKPIFPFDCGVEKRWESDAGHGICGAGL